MLKAEAAGGPVTGQVAVNGTDRILRVSLVPADPPAPRAALEALADADQILLGPGSLFTSVLAAVVVPRILEGVNASSAQRIYLCNLRPQDTETAGYDVARHVDALLAHGVAVDRVVCDSVGHRGGSAGPAGRRRAPGPAQRTGPRPGQTGADPLRSARMTP